MDCLEVLQSSDPFIIEALRDFDLLAIPSSPSNPPSRSMFQASLLQDSNVCHFLVRNLEQDVRKVTEELEDRLHEPEAEAAELRERLIGRSRDVHQEHASKLEAEISQLTREVVVLSGENQTLKTKPRELKVTLRTEQLGTTEAVNRIKMLDVGVAG
ncbi:hypothetical protein CTheo_8176 [Ceratobasidium theobromae]|uniref:Uncharacterized protein n=1 Tax=Ceratobasidium theobromae TaxID=1582974 RepID=A0A5N5Q9E2_9AGAM|nr:hypothetical protein CTheo_8176 [Ceratobasidium theobromae]